MRVNSVGYPANYAKRATVLAAAGNNAFTVRRASDTVSVFSGTLGNSVNNTDTGENVRFADFNSVTAPGLYYLDVTGVGTSVNFSIGDDVYNQAAWVAMMGFYNQRCGQATSMTYNGDTWGHAACHVNDGNLLYYSGSNTVKNGTGGCHDAGDFGKYIVNTGITVGQLLQAWERYRTQLANLTLPHGSNPALPDYLEEVKWELDWVLKMQFPDGRVSHKLTRTGFENYPLMPNADGFTRYFVPWGSAATASFAAMCALASRLYQPYDAAYATTLLNAATLSYNYLVANPADVAPDQSCCSTGGYGSGDGDDRLWAAVEMWETTGIAAQLTDAETRINAQGGDKSDFNWDWGDVSNLGIYTYALSARPGKNATIYNDVRADIVADANAMVTNANAHGYGRALGMYYWGANGTVLRQCEHLDVANRITPNSAFLDTAVQQLSWAFSRNYFNRSQATGLGLNPPLNPHDRESSADAEPNPKPGHLVGGGHPNATSWVDDSADYAQNEIAINWDGALSYALAMWYSGAPGPTATVSPTASPTPTPLACGPSVIQQRVNAGGALYAGTPNWAADQAYAAGSWGYVGGAVSTTIDPQANTSDDALYQAQRYGNPMTYRFTLPNGAYSVTLKLSETYHNAAGLRIFGVTAEGNSVLSNLDIFALSGGQDRAYDTSFMIGVSDGVLDLVFNASVDNASIAGIQISTATSGPCNSPTHSPTATSSRTASETPSRTASPTSSRTATLTRTPSPSASPSATPSSTPSSSPTRTASRSRTSTPSVTPTATLPPPGSTDTHTPTSSPSFSHSPTATPSHSPSSTGTPTLTATRTSTSSATPSASPTPSATQTATATASPSMTATPSVSGTPSSSRTATPTLTSTPTASPTAADSATPSWTPSASPSETEQSTATPTFSATASPTPSTTPPPPQLLAIDVTQGPVSGGTQIVISGTGFAPGLTLTLNGLALLNVTYISPTQVAADTPPAPAGLADLAVQNPDGRSDLMNSAFEFKAWTPTATPATAKKAPKIKKSLPYPQPQNGPVISLAFEIEGNADSVEIKIYSKSMTCVGAWTASGNFGPGWNQAQFNVGGLSGGLYYYLLKVDGSTGTHSNDSAGKLYLLH